MEQPIEIIQPVAGEEAEFEYDWLTREKYEFKILTLIAVLANNNLAYRGTLSDMCSFFGVQNGNKKTNERLIAAINELEKDGLLKKIIDGRTYTLTLSKQAEKKRHIIRIQKEWVNVARNYKHLPNKSESVDWGTLLRVWLFLIDRGNTSIPITDREIGEALGIAAGTVKNARSALNNDIHAILSKKKSIRNQDQNQPFRCIGSQITVSAWIDDVRPAP